MKYLQKWGGAVVCLTILLTVSSAFAQSTSTTRYIDPVNGRADGNCTKTDPLVTNGACTLARAFHSSNQTANTTFLIRVRRAGGMAELAAPTTSLTKSITFGAYVAGGSGSSAAGVLKFTGTLTLARTGQIALTPTVTAEFQNITLAGGGSRFSNGANFVVFKDENDVGKRVTIAGTLTVNPTTAQIAKLIVSKDLTISGVHALLLDELEVKSGATLTLDTQPADYEGGVILFMKKGTSNTDTRGIFRVDGRIVEGKKGPRPNIVFLAHNNFSTSPNRGDGSFFHASSDYTPSASGAIDHTDCLQVTGGGMISVDIVMNSYGNLCVELPEIGNIQVAGSIVERGNQATARTKKNITTDLIFRKEVIVNGDMVQWNDARVVFEQAATIKGDVILADGTLPNVFGGADFGAARDASVRKGVQVGGAGDYTCAYATGASAVHIPGVQFAGAVTIEGGLHVRASSLTDGAPNSAKASAPACAPRVLFLAPKATTTTPAAGVALVSSIAGDIAIEDTASFHKKGRIHLDSDMHGTSPNLRRTAHNVRVGGDLAAGGKTIGMKHASTSMMNGMCTANDTGLAFGNHLVLTDAAESVVIGDATDGLTLDALVTLGDLRVESGKGPLTVTTLHVGSGSELTSTKDVKVTESLILQGELMGELDEASTIKKLTYGNRTTDVVKKAALHTMLDALSISVGSGELRLDEVVKTKNLGLCSGTLSLVDMESTTDSTLHVTEQITVQNGMLEKDSNDPGSISTDKNRYLLKYITPGKRTVTDALEWFAPQDVVVDHAKAEIMVNDDRSVSGKLEVSSGMLMMEDSLNAGSIVLGSATKMGTLQTEGEDVVVNGKVTVNGKSKLVTGGGDLHVLGTVTGGAYTHNTAQVSIAKDAMIHLGDGTLMLGPEDTKKRNNLRDLNGYNTGTDGSGANSRPDVKLTLTGSLTAGMIKVPKGSKETVIDASSDSKMLQTVVFDGTMTPGTNNHDGLLRILSATAAGKMLTIDTLSAMQGAVETHNKKVVITRDVALSSATIWPYAEMTEFMGDLMISGTGGLNTEHNANDAKRSVMIHGDFTQTKGMVSGQVAGVKLHPMTTKTVMGDLMVAADASRYEGKMASGNMPSLMVHGGFHFAKNGKLDVKVEFTGKEAQEVMTGDTTALHSVTVNNAKGLLLKSHVMQQKAATLTLRQGKIHSMPMDSMFMWTVQNVQVEQELRGRSTAQEGEKCGADNDEECKSTILRGSRQSYVGGPVSRHLAQGNAGAGFASGGYLFPVGMEKGDISHYRPLILQLPSDLIDTTAATVSPVMVPDGAMPAWQNLTVPTAGGSLTLDVHADLFWKVDLGEESLPTNTNLRIAAEGLQNVADASGLRIVQWDCMWKNPKLAGRRPAQAEAGSFAVNGYLSGVLHLTQEGIGLGSCAIFGVAANGIENPIDQADLSGGRANLQFIHNVPLPTPIDLHLGDIRIGSGMQFRSATAYRPVGAGSHDLKIQQVGQPAEQAITQTLPLAPNKNYVVIAHGSLAEPILKVLETRMTSQVANQVDVLLVHGSADLGAARVEVLDPIDPMTVNTTLAGNLMLDDATRRYTSLAPSQQIFRVKSMDDEVTEAYEMDLYGYANQTLVLNLSGMRNDLTILGVDRNGMVIPTVVVTGVEESAELPTEFALHGNYPNPFNPSTRIQFDLPENAQVQIQIVDMLGREVITLPAQEMEAGVNRSIELHATSLASGTYLYRLMATGAEQRHVKTGRMTLVK